MTSMFDTAVRERREHTPWASVSPIRFMQDAKWNCMSNENHNPWDHQAVLSVQYRQNVATSEWWTLEWTAEDGQRHRVESQSVDLLMWRAAETEMRARSALYSKLRRSLQADVPDRPKIVCLCGSTRFMEAFFDAGWEETLKGNIVLSVGVCKHATSHGAEVLGPEVVTRLDELHLRKIEMADEILVLNVGGYVGESTRGEINHARALGKPIRWLEPVEEGESGAAS